MLGKDYTPSIYNLNPQTQTQTHKGVATKTSSSGLFKTKNFNVTTFGQEKHSGHTANVLVKLVMLQIVN
jgi:hypothetical protein